MNGVLYCLRTIRPCTSQALRQRLVHSLVVPNLDYCNVVYSDITAEQRLQLQRLANSGIRYIFGVKRSDHITRYRRRLRWMTISTRTDCFTSLMMYRIVNMKEPSFLLPLFKKYKSDKPTRGPRKDLNPETVTTDWGLHSFQVKYTNFWNNIPPCIRDLPSYSRFKNAIRGHLYKSDDA